MNSCGLVPREEAVPFPLNSRPPSWICQVDTGPGGEQGPMSTGKTTGGLMRRERGKRGGREGQFALKCHFKESSKN